MRARDELSWRRQAQRAPSRILSTQCGSVWIAVCAVLLLSASVTAQQPSEKSGTRGTTGGTTAAKPATPPTTQPAAANAAATATAKAQPQWQNLFDGKTMGKWKVAEFGGHGEVRVEDGKLILPAGEGVTGVAWDGDPPLKMDYELSVEAQRVDGHDFFCTITFPVDKASASLVCGGWGGGVCGISSLNGMDASENETTKYRSFDTGKWYTLSLRVTQDSIRAWVDDDPIVDVATKGKEISTRPDIDECKPLGLASWRTTGAIRSVKIRPLTAEEKAAK
jgi:hypothetical protein